MVPKLADNLECITVKSYDVKSCILLQYCPHPNCVYGNWFRISSLIICFIGCYLWGLPYEMMVLKKISMSL